MLYAILKVKALLYTNLILLMAWLEQLGQHILGVEGDYKYQQVLLLQSI